MKINRQNITKLLDRFDFKSLFIEKLGGEKKENKSDLFLIKSKIDHFFL